MFTRRFRNERFFVVWERFRNRVLRIRIELRVQKVFGNVVHYGGPAPVLGSGFEHVYSVKFQLRVQKVLGNVAHFGGPTGFGAKRSKHTFKTVCSWRRFQHGVGSKVNEVRGTAIEVRVQGNMKGFATD